MKEEYFYPTIIMGIEKQITYLEAKEDKAGNIYDDQGLKYYLGMATAFGISAELLRNLLKKLTGL